MNIGHVETYAGSVNAEAVLAAEVSKKLLSSAERALKQDTPWGKKDMLYSLASESGFQNLSSGGFYALGVMIHPDLPKRVYKVARCGEDTDDPYMEYAEWVFQNRLFDQNPHYPRIYDITYAENRTVALVVLEQLEELQWYGAPDYLKDDYWVARRALGLHTDDAPLGWQAHNRPLEAAAKAIYDKWFTYAYMDLHKGNVMLRGEIMVITDPISAL
nr:MAG TPA: hypothetical protein [Caudoviricetes sp.]